MSAQAQAARSLISVGRQQDAVEVLLRALASTPDDHELHCVLAQAYLGMRQPAAALRSAGDAARLAPDEEWPHRLRSIALRRLGRNGEAVDAAMQCVRLAPEEPYARHSLAEAFLAAKHHDQAYAEAYAAVRLDPANADMHDLLGRCMLRKHMYREAETSFRHALQLDPNNAAAHNNLGVVLNGTGRRVEAVHEFNEAARLDPAFETARQNLYSSTRFLVGGGSVVFLLYLLFRASVLVHLSSGSGGFALGLVIVAAAVGFWVWRYRPFVRKPQLPATAIAYYKAETRRLRQVNLPYTLLRLGSIPLAIGILILGLALQSVIVLLVALPVAAGWYWLTPRAWRKLRS